MDVAVAVDMVNMIVKGRVSDCPCQIEPNGCRSPGGMAATREVIYEREETAYFPRGSPAAGAPNSGRNQTGIKQGHTRRDQMDEALKGFDDSIMEGDLELAQEKVQQWLDEGIAPGRILNEGMIAAMGEVGPVI